MRRVDRRDIRASRDREARDGDVAPALTEVAGDVDQAIAGADPDDTRRHARRRYRLDRPATIRHIRGGGRIEAPGDAELRTDPGPVHAAIHRAHDIIEPRNQLVLVPGGEQHRSRGCRARLGRRIDRRTHVDPLFAGVEDLHDPAPAGVDDVRVERIGEHRPPFPAVDRVPVEHRDRAVVAAAARADCAGILLRGVHPVGKTVVRGHVVDLLGALVVPRAPGGAAVKRDHQTLVVPEEHPLAVGGVDPELLGIVTAGSALEAGEGLAAVGRPVARGAHGVDDVGILWIDVDAAVVAALTVADPAVIGRHLAPGGAAVIRSVEATVGNEVEALCIGAQGHRNRRASGQSRQSGGAEFVPGHAIVGRLVDRRAGAGRVRTRGEGELWRPQPVLRVVRRRIVPHAGREDHVRHVVGAGQLVDAGGTVDGQRPVPGLAAVAAAEDPTRVVQGERVTQRADHHDVRVVRVHEHGLNVPRLGRGRGAATSFRRHSTCRRRCPGRGCRR